MPDCLLKGPEDDQNYPEDDRDPTEHSDTDGNVPDDDD